MATVNVNSAKDVKAAVEKYLGSFPGSVICARQLWYEGLGGQGIAKAPEVETIEAAIAATPGWTSAGDVRYEKFGVQASWRRS
jgi:hypothetical protein